jgi:hypothetical protein
MSAGQYYENELLVIGKKPSWYPQMFSTYELNDLGSEFIFNQCVLQPSIFGHDSLCPLSYVTDLWGSTNSRTPYHSIYYFSRDPFWGCIKEVVLKLGICKDESSWPSSIALTYLYKIAFSNRRVLMEKPRMLQFNYCKEMLRYELSILKPKRVLFLSGDKCIHDFLDIPCKIKLNDCVRNLGKFDFGVHKAQTVVTLNPKMCPREKLVKSILDAFNN